MLDILIQKLSFLGALFDAAKGTGAGAEVLSLTSFSSVADCKFSLLLNKILVLAGYQILL